jgi:hypothetical protein
LLPGVAFLAAFQAIDHLLNVGAADLACRAVVRLAEQSAARDVRHGHAGWQGGGGGGAGACNSAGAGLRCVIKPGHQCNDQNQDDENVHHGLLER